MVGTGSLGSAAAGLALEDLLDAVVGLGGDAELLWLDVDDDEDRVLAGEGRETEGEGAVSGRER